MAYDLNTLVRLTAQFTDSTGTIPTDPTSVQVITQDPSGTQVVNTAVVRDGVGSYHFDVLANKSGAWSYRWEGTGTCTVASDQTFLVNSSPMYNL